jgi:Ice-binding-like/Secretion system C-terminal sorting domain
MEVFMQNDTTSSTGNINSRTCFFAGMLIAVLIIHAAALSQSTAVNLGTAVNFVILAKTGVSTTGVTSITGDVGLSPAAATFITGFGLIADHTNTFSTSSLISGKIYASNYAAPTPINMTTAISDMQTAYTDAAGRSLPDSTELGAGDITGKTIPHGLYKWGTGVLISAGGVTISGSATDIWIFQVAGNLTVANGAIVTLSGGARAANIYWQVGGQVVIGTTVQMQGNILSQTLISMNAGATLNGRALAQTAVTMIGNTVVTEPAAATYVADRSLSPYEFVLSQNYPDPFNPSTVIQFTIPSNGRAVLKVFNILGQEVATLFNDEAVAGVNHQVQFNGSNFASGIYFSRLEFGGKMQVKKMVLLK